MMKKQNKRFLQYSTLGAFMAVIVFMFFMNLNVSFGLETDMIEKYSTLLGFSKDNNSHTPENVLLVNIAYDRQLVDIEDELGIPVGNTDLTNRKKIFDFLYTLHNSNNYRFILLDIDLSKKLGKTIYDDSLCNLISKMDRIAIPAPVTGDLLSPKLVTKSYPSLYTKLLWNDKCAKYPLVYDGKLSIASYMYQEVNKKDITSFCGIIFDKNGLLPSSINLTLPYFVKSAYQKDGEKNYYNLGSDILANGDSNVISRLSDNKIVLIGDFVERDMHNTYLGMQPGVMIHYNIYDSLLSGRAYITIQILLLMWIVCFVLTLLQFHTISVAEIIAKIIHIKNQTAITLLTWIDYTLLFELISFCIFIFCGKIYEVIIMSTYLTLQNYIIGLCKKHLE